MSKSNQLAKLDQSGKPYIIYKSQTGFDLYTNFSKKIVLNNKNIQSFLKKKNKKKIKNTDLYIGFFGYELLNNLIDIKLPRQKDFSLDPIIKNVKKKKKRGGSFKESTLFERIKSKSFFNPKDIKPTFPENPPPKLDPKTGMHPDYGKSAKRYKKLDPASANAMPRTGDPETDAIVDKQRTKPRKN